MNRSQNNLIKKLGLGLLVFGAMTGYFVVNAAAQERVINRFELDKMRTKAELAMRNLSHRVVTTTETFRARDGKQSDSSVATREFVLPDRRHTIFEIRAPWTPATKDESIYIGDVLYSRSADGPWELIPPSTTVKKDPWPAFVRLPYNAVVRFIEKTTLEGQKVDVYEAVSTSDAFGTPPTKTTDTTRFWIREDGLYAKKVSEGENVQRQYFKRQTVTYEYNIKVKIDKPAVSKSKQ